MKIDYRFLSILIIILIDLISESGCLKKEKCGVAKVSARANEKSISSDALPIGQIYVQSRNNRVVGGQESQPHIWPWMAALVRGNYYICGGVLIDPQYVLTAAHCVIERPSPQAYRIILGAHNLYQGRVFQVTRIIYHQMFNKGLPPRGNDIAILKLSQPADLSSPNIGLVCMPSMYLTGAGGRECVVTGWGRLSEGGPPSIKLQEVSVPIVDNNVCNDAKHYSGLVDSTMLCAGWEEGGKDTCQGDSGGPLVCDINGQWQLHGIVSWGYGCARPNKPGVYARVSVFQNWITSQMAALKRENRTAFS